MKVCDCDSKMFVWFVLFLGLVPATLGYATNRNDEHSFRHQQHYNQRIEQAVNDFKISQAHKNATQVYLRHHHVSIDDKPPSRTATTLEPLLLPERHHLRHYNRHHQTWEHRVFPASSQSPFLKRNSFLNGDQINLTNTMENRYFDRDGLYSMTKPKIGNFAIHGPKSRDTHQNVAIKKSSDDRYKSFESKTRFDYDDQDSIVEDDSTTSNNARRTKINMKASVKSRNLDEYYDDDDSMEDDEDDSEEDNNFDNFDDNRNKIDNENLPNKRNKHFDSEDVFSRSYIPGTLTKRKYETLGTHEAVKQSRLLHITNQQQHRALANAHVSKVYMEAGCKWPKPKVEKIQKDPSKMYVPHCTILHRCADDTGCCSTETQTCVPKHSESVDLYFYVNALGSKQGTIERHTFVNHTECQCVDKIKYLNQAPSPLMRKATVLDCNCPKLFEKVLQENGVCRCDCSSGNSGCDWLKRGMEHFSMADRKCIIEGRCKPPTCEYGSYIRKHGRCPRKEDKLAFSRSYH